MYVYCLSFSQYGVNGSWIDIPSHVTENYAVHIPSNHLLRFIPNEDFFGPASLTVLAADGKLCICCCIFV